MIIPERNVAKIETALSELVSNRSPDYLHPDDRQMLADTLALCTEARTFLATDAEREAARGEYGHDECEIGEDASTSPSDEGTWVGLGVARQARRG